MPNRNNDRPEQAFAKSFRDHLLSFKEMVFEPGKQQDSIAAWLVGMSTGAIALIIAQSGKFSPTLYPALKWSVSFLTGTITFGLLFRIFHLFLQERNQSNLRSVVAWLAACSEDTTEAPIELPEDASAELIAWCLYDHMGIDMTPELMIDVITKNDVEYWRNQYEEYTTSYHRLEEANDQTRKRMIEDLYAFISDLEGLPVEKYEQIVKRDKSDGIRKRRIGKICTLSYILMCISFAISVLFISCGFIKTDLKMNPSSATTNQKVSPPSQQVQPSQVDKSD